MEFEKKEAEASYLIVSSGLTLKLHFGKGCSERMIYDDTAAINRLADLKPAFCHDLFLLKKEGDARYQFFPKKGSFMKVEEFKIN